MTHAKQRLGVLVSSILTIAPGVGLADNAGARIVDCSSGHTIQDAIGKGNPDRAVTLLVRGTCIGNVSITRDDVSLVGEGGVVNGGISIIGARRILIRTLTVSHAQADGIFATDNAAVTVEDSTIESNGQAGVRVRNGAHANLNRNLLRNNGTGAVPDTGRGIQATQNASVDARNNVIVDNRSDGVGVFNNGYAWLSENTIERNGRLAAGEAGIQVSRARVRGGGNTIRNNTGSTAVLVVNHGDYRTGTAVNLLDLPDSEFPFEQISHPVGAGRFAIDVNNNAYGDFRQADITGSINVGAMSMMQVRGDDVGPDLRCATLTVPPGGTFGVNSRGFLRFRYTQVTAPAIPPNTEFQNPQCPVSPPA